VPSGDRRGFGTVPSLLRGDVRAGGLLIPGEVPGLFRRRGLEDVGAIISQGAPGPVVGEGAAGLLESATEGAADHGPLVRRHHRALDEPHRDLATSEEDAVRRALSAFKKRAEDRVLRVELLDQDSWVEEVAALPPDGEEWVPL
jgi:hypothetical protein